MLSNSYFGAFNRYGLKGYNPATVRIPFLRGVFTIEPDGQLPTPRVQPVRIIKGPQKVTNLGAYQYFREHL